RVVGILGDEPPVFELGVGDDDPAGRFLPEPLLLEPGVTYPVLRMRSYAMNTNENELALDFTDHGLPAINVGRYVLHRQIARGGMATIHIARLMGDEGFSRIVAAKRLLPEFAEDQ